MDIYLASANAHKHQEFSALLRLECPDITLRHPDEIGGMPDVEETGKTFRDNALLKAWALHKQMGNSKHWVLADDSGLEVEALDGRPGVFSARFAGDDATDEQNNQLLLKKLAEKPDATRRARFVCCLALLSPQQHAHIFTGDCAGIITPSPSGNYGFGYDPLFLPNGFRRTFAELGNFQKNGISHRARALRQLARWRREQTIAGE